MKPSLREYPRAVKQVRESPPGAEQARHHSIMKAGDQRVKGGQKRHTAAETRQVCGPRRGQLTADRDGAGGTFLGKQVAEAVEAVSEVVPRGEALADQLILAPDANEALLVPGLVPVVHSSAGDGLEGTTSRVQGQKLFGLSPPQSLYGLSSHYPPPPSPCMD